MLTDRDLMIERNQEIVKANELIQKKRYSLSLYEQKLLLYLISKIKPTDAYDTVYTISIDNFIDVCGKDADNGGNTNHIKKTIIKLLSKPIVYKEGNWDVITNWFAKARLNEKEGTFVVKFSEDLAPYLFNLSANFTKYPLVNALPMKSKYGIRIYELCRSVAYKKDKPLMLKLEELRAILDCYKHPVYKDFRVNVLEPAIDDINNYTDLHVEIEPKRTGHRITDLIFTIEPAAKPEKQHFNRWKALNIDRAAIKRQQEILKNASPATIEWLKLAKIHPDSIAQRAMERMEREAMRKTATKPPKSDNAH